MERMEEEDLYGGYNDYDSAFNTDVTNVFYMISLQFYILNYFY